MSDRILVTGSTGEVGKEVVNQLVAKGWGGVLSLTHYIGSKWMPFVRAG